MTQFKPMLAPNEKLDLSTIKYPILASNKLDGVRCIIRAGSILTRSLKSIPCKQLNEKLESLRKWTKDTGSTLDGEIYSPKLTFQEIIHFVMTKDLTAEAIPEHLKFYCFDILQNEKTDIKFIDRIEKVKEISNLFTKTLVALEHTILLNEQDVSNHFTNALLNDCEGLILRSFTGHYKYGRGTMKEGLIYKIKPFITTDAKIIGVVQSTEANQGALKTINELGRSKTSQKKDDRHLIEKASAFVVDFKGNDLKVTLAMTDNQKVAIWKNRDLFIGKIVEYRYLEIGMKEGGLPRHPTTIRMRPDR